MSKYVSITYDRRVPQARMQRTINNVVPFPVPPPTPPTPPTPSYLISGTVSEAGTGFSAPIEFIGLGTIFSAASGSYGQVVIGGYSGTAIPHAVEPGTFSPQFRTYISVSTDFSDQHYVFTGTDTGTNFIVVPDDLTDPLVIENAPRDAVYTSGTIYLVDNAKSYSSVDGFTFGLLADTGITPRSLAFGLSTYVCGGFGGDLVTSPDGVVWTPQTSNTASSLLSMTFAIGTFVAVGDSGNSIVSTDTVNWTQNNVGTGNTLRGVTFGAGLFVAVGTGGVIFTSVNGSAWSSQVSGTIEDLNAVTFGNGLFVAVGANGVILTSPDAVNWGFETGDTGNLLAVAYGNGRYVTGSAEGNCYMSLDTINWTFVRALASQEISRNVFFPASNFLLLAVSIS